MYLLDYISKSCYIYIYIYIGLYYCNENFSSSVLSAIRYYLSSWIEFTSNNGGISISLSGHSRGAPKHCFVFLSSFQILRFYLRLLKNSHWLCSRDFVACIVQPKLMGFGHENLQFGSPYRRSPPFNSLSVTIVFFQILSYIGQIEEE